MLHVVKSKVHVIVFSSPEYHILDNTSEGHNYIPTGKIPSPNSEADSNVSSEKDKHLVGHCSNYHKLRDYANLNKQEEESDDSNKDT